MRVNILVECPELLASVQVGVLEPLLPLGEAGLCEVRFRETKQITRQDLCWCDAVICVRGCEYPTLRMVREAKRIGRFLLYFLDDDLLDIPPGIASTKYFSDRRIQSNLQEILMNCDVLWAINQKVLDKYGRWCARAALSRVPAEISREPQWADKPFHIVYAGSVDHGALVRDQLAPAVKRLLMDFPGELDFTFIGADSGLGRLHGIRQIPFFNSYAQYRKVMRESNFSIGLAPASEKPFYTYKYYNKFVEYASLGIAGIYASCGPYPPIVRHKQNGLLCEGTPESWYDAIRWLIEHPQERTQYAKQAAAQLKQEFNAQIIAQNLQKAIPELSKFHAPKTDEQDLHLPPMRLLFYLERMRLLWRMHGFFALFIIPWKALSKLRKTIQKKLRNK